MVKFKRYKSNLSLQNKLKGKVSENVYQIDPL